MWCPVLAAVAWSRRMIAPASPAHLAATISPHRTKRQISAVMVSAFGVNVSMRSTVAAGSPATVAAQPAAITPVHGVLVGFGDPAGFYVSPFGPSELRHWGNVDQGHSLN